MRRLKPTRFPRRKPSQRAFLTMYKAMRRTHGHLNWWPGETPFEVMVGAMLTQNTAWRNVELAISNLKSGEALSPRAISRMPPSYLSRLIRPAGYFNVKARRLKNLIEFFLGKYAGNIARMRHVELYKLRRELLEVNGIGQETADSILLYGLDKPIFVVDAYTRRVMSRHRYLSENESYEDIQRIFMRHLPKSVGLYNDYHAQLVEVGKRYCRKSPRCEICPLQQLL